MKFSVNFRNHLKTGPPMLGTNVSLTDPTATEAACRLFDYVWIDMEHGAFSPESVQSCIIAAQGMRTPTLVRVAWNDPVLIKPVLDMGADGVVIPLIRTVDDARRAVSGCLYPPQGVRGFGPRRANGFGELGGEEYCRLANDSVVVIIQIEHIDAVENIDEILRVPGITSLLIGSNDLAGSMGLTGQPRHPRVLERIGHVFAAAATTGMPVGVAVGDDPAVLSYWLKLGARWLSIAGDVALLLRGAGHVIGQLRHHHPELHESAENDRI